MQNPFIGNILIEYNQMQKRNRALLLAFQSEVKQLAAQILNPLKQQCKPTPSADHVDYNTRKKVVENKELQLMKTKKEEALFECIEMEVEHKDSQPKTDLRTLSSPILGGFMVTDLKKDYELEAHKCTEFK